MAKKMCDWCHEKPASLSLTIFLERIHKEKGEPELNVDTQICGVCMMQADLTFGEIYVTLREKIAASRKAEAKAELASGVTGVAGPKYGDPPNYSAGL